MWKGLIFALLFLTACAPAKAAAPDLYMAAKYSQATADAAQYQSKFLGDQLTGTSQAPITGITQTAAALIVGQTQSMMTRAAYSPTPSVTPSITPTPTPNLTATMEISILIAKQKAIENNTERDNLELERQRVMNDFNARMPGYLIVSALALAIILIFSIVRRNRVGIVQRDARGDAPLIIDYVDGQTTDVDRNPNFATDKKENLFAIILKRKMGIEPQLPALTAERQDRTTERDQLVDLATRGLLKDESQGMKARRRFAGEQIANGQRQLPGAPMVHIVDASQMAGILRPILPDVAQDAMDAEVLHHEEG